MMKQGDANEASWNNVGIDQSDRLKYFFAPPITAYGLER